MVFTNQVAVVTGASSGVGKAVALALAAQGARVCLVGRNLELLESLIEAAQSSSQFTSYQADLMSDEELEQLSSRLKEDFERIDMLVHSAGVISMGQIDRAPVKDFDWQYRINVRAPYVLTQALLPKLKESQGQIVFINSSAGLTAKANVSQYAATKHALKGVADSLRDEVNADGIRVLSVFLGRTASPMQKAVHEMEGRKYNPQLFIQPEDVASITLSALSLPRSAEVTDITIRPMKKS